VIKAGMMEQNRVGAKCLTAILLLLLMVTYVHAAVEYDVSYQDAVETVNGAIYMQWDEPQPTGTGVIDAFVQIQGPPDAPQYGYNTNGTPEFHTQPGCRTLLLADIPTVEILGVNYREFLLDINQNATHNILSVDEVEIYLEATDSLSGYPGCFSTYPAIYDLDAGVDNYIKLNDDWGAGSGKGDMLLFVPDGLFTNAANYNPTGNNYIYLYSRFGDSINGADGFEEWAIGSGGPIIPEPATIVLMGLGALLLRKRQA